MAIAFRASSAAGAATSSQVTSETVTIPAAVLAGDVIVIHAVQVPISSTVGVLTVTSTGTTPVAQGSQATASETLPATVAGGIWTIIASSSDAGKVITVASTTTGFISVAIAAYTGVDNTTPVDVVQGAATTGGNTASLACPSLTTGYAGDWALYCGGGAGEGGNLTPPSGSTSRESVFTSGINVYAVIADGNGSAGASGTVIGGGAYTTGSASNSIFCAFTVGLKAASSGTTHSGAAALSGSGTLTAAPGTNASSTLSGSGTLTAGASWPLHGAVAMSGTGTLGAAGADVPPFTMTYVSTDGHGTQTWSCSSALNGPSASTVRILPPSAPNTAYRHSFLFALPVSTGTDATFGDPPTVIGQDLNAVNGYNTTLVVPSFPIDPWYADNPGNSQQSQESFMLALAEWMATSMFASGGELNFLIGFSKSGIGGQGLQFHRPDIWAATASWDAPFMMTDYDGTDPTLGSQVGGNSANCYGTSANFKANYQLSAAHLTAWAPAGSFTTRQRLWIGGYYAFQPDVNAYMSELATAGILFDGSWNTLDASHAWHDGWVADALASIMTATGPAAALSGTGTLTAGSSRGWPGAVALSGSGTLTAGRQETVAGAVAMSGSGVLTATGGVPPAFTVGILTAATSSGVNTSTTSP